MSPVFIARDLLFQPSGSFTAHGSRLEGVQLGEVDEDGARFLPVENISRGDLTAENWAIECVRFWG